MPYVELPRISGSCKENKSQRKDWAVDGTLVNNGSKVKYQRITHDKKLKWQSYWKSKHKGTLLPLAKVKEMWENTEVKNQNYGYTRQQSDLYCHMLLQASLELPSGNYTGLYAL